MSDIQAIYGGFHGHRATPSHHPFTDGFSLIYKPSQRLTARAIGALGVHLECTECTKLNQPAIGAPPI